MAEVGTYYITVMPEMSKFTSGVNSALGNLGTESGKKFSTSFGQILAGSALGTALGSFATQVGSAIMGGLSTGIARLDTIENFPRVMESLGYTSSEAADSIQLIMQHLDGLPTATQDMVTLTQALSDSTGDLDLATRAALGFNDMMLANGASSAEMASAQGVLNRVIGKGSATVAQWQSLMAVMPAQLGMVAREMLGAEATSEDLHAALEDGTVGWNDFLRAVVKLDEEGSESLASFEEQARANSHGIGTAINNVKNRIGAGWASILDSIGRENISSAIDRASYGIRDAMGRVADAFKWLKYTILGTNIDESVGRIFDNIKGFVSGIDLSGLKDLARALIELVDGALGWIADNGDTVGLALSMMAGALAVLVGIQLGTWFVGVTGAIGAFMTAIGGLTGIIQFGLLGAIGALVAGLVWFFTQTEEGQAIWQGFCDLMSETWQGLQEDWAYLMDVLSQEWDSFKTWVDGIPEWWAGIVDGFKAKLDEWGQWWSTSWNDAVTSVKTACDSITKWWDGFVKGFKAKLDEWGRWWKKSWDDAVQSLKTACNNILNSAKTAWNNLKTATSEAWENLKTATSQAWENLKTTIHDKVTAAKNAVSQAWTNVKTATSQAWDNIRTSVSDKANAIRTAVTDKFNALGTSISGIWSGIRSSAIETWDGIKNAISEKITAAKDKVSEMISNIKGLFNFSWSLPRPSLPHINWHMESIAGLLSVPVFDGISWWAKGGIFENASIIGVGEGRDAEAVLPLNDKTYGAIAHGIAGELGGGGGVVVTGNTFYVRSDRDIEAIGVAINQQAERERRSLL